MKWPGKIKANSVSKEVISQIDIMATLAAITEVKLPKNAAPDSYDLTPVITSKTSNTPLREATIHNTFENIWGIRQGDWLYINYKSGSKRKAPAFFNILKGYNAFETPGLLFNMTNDPEQKKNLYDLYPEKIKVLDALLNDYRIYQSSVVKN
jgi:arylsulfatase A-like enzyme